MYGYCRKTYFIRLTLQIQIYSTRAKSNEADTSTTANEISDVERNATSRACTS